MENAIKLVDYEEDDNASHTANNTGQPNSSKSGVLPFWAAPPTKQQGTPTKQDKVQTNGKIRDKESIDKLHKDVLTSLDILK